MRLSPLEWIGLIGMGLGLIYGLVVWAGREANCFHAPGSLELRVADGRTAFAYGGMQGQALCKLRAVAKDNPGLERLVLVSVPGTLNLTDTEHATRFVRRQGWDTVVPSNGEIASGGVMLFLGGVNRTVEPGGRVGVHSWSSPVPGALFSSPEDITPSADRAFRKIYRQMGVSDGFYDFQIEAAPPETIHWMTRFEMQEWDLVTG